MTPLRFRRVFDGVPLKHQIQALWIGKGDVKVEKGPYLNVAEDGGRVKRCWHTVDIRFRYDLYTGGKSVFSFQFFGDAARVERFPGLVDVCLSRDLRIQFGLSAKGGGEHLFCPRRATEGHEEGQGQLQERQLQKVKGNCNFFGNKQLGLDK